MAWAIVNEYPFAGSASVTPSVVTGVTASVGDVLIVLGASSGGRTMTSVTDSAGTPNTYTVHRTGAASTVSGAGVASCKVTSALAAGTVSVTWSAANFSAIRVLRVTGLDTTTGTSNLRTVAAAATTATTGTVAACGTTAANCSAGDLVIAFSGQQFTAANPYSAVQSGFTDQTEVSSTGTFRTMDWATKTAAGGATETATNTLANATTGVAGIIVAFAVAAVAASVKQGLVIAPPYPILHIANYL